MESLTLANILMLCYEFLVYNITLKINLSAAYTFDYKYVLSSVQ